MENLIFNESPIIAGTVIGLGTLSTYYEYYIITSIIVIVFLILLWFYRYNKPIVDINTPTIYSPASGTIHKILETPTHRHIIIILNVFDEHTQCYPVTGEIISHIYDRTGKFHIVNYLDKSKLNEKTIDVIKPNWSDESIIVYRYAGFLTRKITIAKTKSTVKAGEYMGMIKFGSRVDIIIPKIMADISVNVGDYIYAGDRIST